MIIIDRALSQRQVENNPIRVGMVGAGFMGRGIALQIACSVPGMDLVAISNRHLEAAKRCYQEAGISDVQLVSKVSELDNAIRNRRYSVTDDPTLLCKTKNIDAIIEVTGTIEFGAHVVLEAIQNQKHIILMNAELDGTLGPILNSYAKEAGVVFTNSDGDQPGVIMNLYRFVKGIGVRPILCGNIKGFHDAYRNPTTQEEFARKWGESSKMITSFTDGTKISFEQAIVANATGMKAAQRGLISPIISKGLHIRDAIKNYPLDLLSESHGIVDYVVGAEPSPGVFVVGMHEDPRQRHYLNLYKLGEGPYYCFYHPYHLCHFEVANTVARAVLFKDPTIQPIGPPVVDVICAAKKNLKSGEVLDGIGQYMLYGVCENSEVVLQENLLPIGLSEGCRLKRDIAKDHFITYSDIDLPKARLSDKLRTEQSSRFLQTVK